MPWLKVTYQINSSPADIAARAEAVSVEQSVEMPVPAIRHQHVLDEILGKVDGVEQVGENLYNAHIRLSEITTGYEPAQLINVLFGNSSLQETVQLLDAEFPQSLLDHFPGPKFGIEGLRKLVDGYNRPLTCTALKPQGISADDLGKIAYTFAQAGIDFIKDDHGIANQSYSTVAERIKSCHAAVQRANRETGQKTYYVPNLCGSPKQLIEYARIVREEGVQCVMIAPMLVGMATFAEVYHEHLNVPVLGHPAFAGAARISPIFLFGKLFRLFGCDSVIYPNYGGRFSYSKQQCLDLANTARGPWSSIKPAFPVPAGGMTVDRVQEMIDFYGNDTMLLIGGGLLSAGDALLERSREFVNKVMGR